MRKFIIAASVGVTLSASIQMIAPEISFLQAMGILTAAILIKDIARAFE